MAITYKKTLTVIGVRKNIERFSESVDHALYDLGGVEKTLPIFKTIVTDDTVKIYLYFDDGVVGNVTNIRLIDKDGDEIVQVLEGFPKESHIGFYILFRYKFVEEVE